MNCSAGQSQSTRQGQVGQQISPEPGSTGQRQAERATPAPIYPQQTDHEQFLQKFTKHRLFGQWKKLRTSILCSVVFIYKTRDELSRHLCSALFLSSHLYWGTWLFPWSPLDWILPMVPPPPPCYTIKKILETPLHKTRELSSLLAGTYLIKINGPFISFPEV